MARRNKFKKSKPVEEIDIEITEENVTIPEITPEVRKIFDEEQEKELVNVELPTIEEIEEEEMEEPLLPPINPDYPDKFPVETPEIKKEKKIGKEDLMKLSKKGLRYYQRTGKLPNE